MSLIQPKGSFDRSAAVAASAAAMPDEQQEIARSLRRMKRRLLLQSAGVSLPPVLMEKPKTQMIFRSSSHGTEVSYSSSPTMSATSPIRAAMMASAAAEPESPSNSALESAE